MEGIVKDQMLFRFWRLDPSDLGRDATLVLDVTGPYRGSLIRFCDRKHRLNPFLSSPNLISTPSLARNPGDNT